MSEAVKRSNALYAVLADYWYNSGAVDKQTLMEEVENHLDDIIKTQDALKLDLTTLSEDVAQYLDLEYFSRYPRLFDRQTDTNCGAKAYIQMWPKYKQAMQLLSEAIVEISRKNMSQE